MKGLEPPRLAASDPKSDAATNYATPAKNSAANLTSFFGVCKFFFVFFHKKYKNKKMQRYTNAAILLMV